MDAFHIGEAASRPATVSNGPAMLDSRPMSQHGAAGCCRQYGEAGEHR